MTAQSPENWGILISQKWDVSIYWKWHIPISRKWHISISWERQCNQYIDYSNIIIIEEATSARIKRPDEKKTGLSQNKPHTQGSTTEVVNQSSENVDFIRVNTVPGNKSYADVAMSRKTKNGFTKKVIVFGDSIIRGIRVREFNQQVKNGYAKFKSFPGCNSKEMLHYIEPTLETGFYDITRGSKWSTE